MQTVDGVGHMSGNNSAKQGSLIAVGTGLCLVGQLTVEAMAWMRRADRLLYVVTNPVAEAVLHELNPAGAESLHGFYVDGRHRSEIYEAMAERALHCVREGHLTCFASYGHPGLFANPIHHAIRRTRAEGYEARMIPGISTLDCLFADLEIDPAIDGFSSFDATDFMLNDRAIDTTAGLILWQIGVIGDPYCRTNGYSQDLLPKLAERLGRFYPPGHVVLVYNAASLPWEKPLITPIPVDGLSSEKLTPLSSVYVPPVRATPFVARNQTPVPAVRSDGDRDLAVASLCSADTPNARNL
jgi:uncharacterized protein YabN with tetrapyrrole methylase and pyrophosphatase domain